MSLVGQPYVASSEEPQPVESSPRSWVGAVLLVSVALQLTGAFLRYQSIQPPRLSDLSSERARSFSFTYFDALHGGGLVFFLSLALITVLGVAVALRPNRVRGALVGGFCASTVGTTVYLTLYATEASKSVHFGPGFLIILAGLAIEGCAAALILAAVASSPRDHAPAGRSGIGLALATAFVVGASNETTDLKFFHVQPLALFTPLSFKSGAAALVAFVSVAAVPLLAARVRGRVGSAMVVGLAAYEATRVVDVLDRRFVWPDLSPAQVTLGWWIEILAVALLVAMALRLATHKQAPIPSVAAHERPNLVT